jgi:molybdopterin-guanine dinucleotide biosynthesis protein A
MAVILIAGGQSKRLGRDKAWETVGGVPLITRVLDAASVLKMPALIVANQPERYETLSSRADLLRDELPALGPLGGLYTGLLATPDRDNLLLPCDAPFLNPGLLTFLLQRLAGRDAVIPTAGGKSHPAIAAYSSTCLPAIEKSLAARRLKLVSFLDSVNAEYVAEETIEKLDPEGLSFFNINNAADLARAECLAGER